MTLGIVAVSLLLIPVVSQICGILAIAFAGSAFKTTRHTLMVRWGLALGIVSVAWAVFWILLIVLTGLSLMSV